MDKLTKLCKFFTKILNIKNVVFKDNIINSMEDLKWDMDIEKIKYHCNITFSFVLFLFIVLINSKALSKYSSTKTFKYCTSFFSAMTTVNTFQ